MGMGLLRRQRPAVWTTGQQTDRDVPCKDCGACRQQGSLRVLLLWCTRHPSMQGIDSLVIRDDCGHDKGLPAALRDGGDLF
jgi:hypothetical protein